MIRRGSPIYRKLFGRDQACVWHGWACDQDTLVPQHRAGKGMGGSQRGDRLSNLVLLCSRFNGLIESDADVAELAREKGVKVSRSAITTLAPLQHAVLGVVYLDDEGGYWPSETPF